MNNNPIYRPSELPDRLLSVVHRLCAGDAVYGFEIELLADFTSQ